jgi:DNA-binding PadR family transcriptional regulator
METNSLTENNQPVTTTEAIVLGLVAFGERSGYDLARFADQSVGYLWAPSRSQIYKVLPRLRARRLVRAQDVPQQGRPDKALYTITDRGRTVLRAWLETVEDEPAGGPNVFVLKLFFCDFVPPAVALAHLAAYRRFLVARLRAYETMRRDPGPGEPALPQLVLRRAIIRIQSTLTWIDDAETAVERGAVATPSLPSDPWDRGQGS